jgi:hypothetical protein
MKRLAPLLLLIMCGCAQGRAERREAVGKALLAPVALAAWWFESAMDKPTGDPILDAPCKIRTDGSMDP